ncbi:MAG TPA: LUD domain-containing protein, partial [Bryobacteraceae bacterium]|nr:LUD domain-containing protein [Bryobacteraceae bacterium]
MTGAPEEKIHETLVNIRLQTAIYTSTARLADHRRTALATLPEFEELRTQANLIKRHTIENLGFYLEQFESNAKAHGVQVVWARDADEVADFVWDLAKRKSARLIVKSKSMTSEEIDLNERLA